VIVEISYYDMALPLETDDEFSTLLIGHLGKIYKYIISAYSNTILNIENCYLIELFSNKILINLNSYN
jgi:hypothetical protein